MFREFIGTLFYYKCSIFHSKEEVESNEYDSVKGVIHNKEEYEDILI